MEKFFDAIKKTTPDLKRVPEFDATGEFAGIQAITYDGAEKNGKKTKIFAYLGYPEKINEKVPAVVLVHGGGGVAFLHWVKMWNERGYAALAIATTGDFPTKINAGDDFFRKKDEWHYGLYGIFLEDGYINAPGNDEMRNSDKEIAEQWMYHAVSQVILGANLLRNDPQVDSDKVGIVGISWGGVITSLAIGYDNRFAFAVPIYGSGYLAESMGSLGDTFRSGKNPELWLAEKNFKNVTMPVLWLCWNKDMPFSINSNSKSYLATVKNNPETRFSAVHEMRHDHCWAWVRKEPFAFADFVCKKQKRLPTFDLTGDKFEIVNSDGCFIPLVKLYYIDEPLSYTENHKMEQQWKMVYARYRNGILEYEVPTGAKAYYLEMSTILHTEAYITCSPFVEVENRGGYR